MNKSYDGVRTSLPKLDKPYDNAYNDVRARGAFPPAYSDAQVKRAKGQINSTSSAMFIYACIRRSETGSSRSTVPTLTTETNSSTTLGYSNDASMSNLEKFDRTDQTAGCLPVTPEDFPSTSRFDLLNATPESGYAPESVEFSNHP